MYHKIEKPQIELHAHLGSSVDPGILWSIANRQGIKLPTRNFWDFVDMVTIADHKKNKSLDDMHNNLYHWTELIQSSPEAILESVKSVIAGGYKKCNIVYNELRFNPMFRNRGGERDLDYIILSASWGVEQAILEHSEVKAGLILMVERMQDVEEGKIIFDKAIKYKDRGIIGVDIAGAERDNFSMQKYKPLFLKAKEAGLGVSIHTGEAGSLEEMWFVVEEIKPHRIGHGVKAHSDKKLMEALVKNDIVLELCPSSNLKNSIIPSVDEMRKIYRTLFDAGIKLTINTDGPEMYRTNIIREQEFLIQNNIFTEDEVEQMRSWAFASTFLK